MAIPPPQQRPIKHNAGKHNAGKHNELGDKDSRPYRPCVGLMVINKHGQVFVGTRIDTPGDHWQMPQGGIEKNENPKAAAMRELAEEIGTSAVEIIAEAPAWHHYDLPHDLSHKLWRGKYRGQKQKWFLLRFTGDDSAINIATENPEFRAWRWVDPDALVGLIIPFKREIYRKVLVDFGGLIK